MWWSVATRGVIVANFFAIAHLMSSHDPNHPYHPHSGHYSHYTVSVPPYHGSSPSPDAKGSFDMQAIRNQPREDSYHSSRPPQSASVRQDSDLQSNTAHFPLANHPTLVSLSSAERSIHNRAPYNGGGQSESSEWMRGNESDHYSTPPSATTSTVSPSSVASPSFPHGFHNLSRDENNIVLPQPPIKTLADESYPSSPSSMGSILPSPSPVDQFAPPTDVSPDTDPSASYAFVPPHASHVKKRPRRRYDEIERVYFCTFPDCFKGYGTLNHLNAHIHIQGHGPKRDASGEPCFSLGI
jgi:transcription factor CON7